MKTSLKIVAAAIATAAIGGCAITDEYDQTHTAGCYVEYYYYFIPGRQETWVQPRGDYYEQKAQRSITQPATEDGTCPAIGPAHLMIPDRHDAIIVP